jgi:hypothetical protein
MQLPGSDFADLMKQYIPEAQKAPELLACGLLNSYNMAVPSMDSLHTMPRARKAVLSAQRPQAFPLHHQHVCSLKVG